jgi:hypothetical protein
MLPRIVASSIFLCLSISAQDFRSPASQYASAVLGPGAVAEAMVSASVISAVGDRRFVSRIGASLARNGVQQSIQFGAAALLKQDERFTPLREGSAGRRMRSALYRSFFVRGRVGDEIAFPRLAAAVGTGWVTHEWHPWQQANPNPWLTASAILCGYVARSYWQEFKPEIKRGLRRLFTSTVDR